MSCEAHRQKALRKIGNAPALESAFQQGKSGNGVAAYADAKRTVAKGKVGADIVERWNTRVVPAKLHERGAAGADEYLDRYGKGISAEKVIKFALQAEVSGATEMANRFWARAFALENKLTDVPAFGGNGATKAVEQKIKIPPTTTMPLPTFDDFSTTMQPGKFSTMQPVDADVDRETLINDDSYWAQPKRDGERRVVFVGENGCAYQSRSLSLKGRPSEEIENALEEARRKLGPFVLDGEVYYSDFNGREHRTAAQAYTSNVELGHPDFPTPATLAIFKALHAEGRDLTQDREEDRILAGEKIGKFLFDKTLAGEHIEVVPTARTAKEKAALVKQQQKEGREGEVWVKHNCRYTGGKQKGGAILRTKNIQEMDVVITGLTPTTAAGRAFGAIEVAAYQNGKLKPLGSIGTGFTQDEMAEIAAQFKANPNGSVITIASQGFTEKGQVWHGRYRGLRDDKAAKECVLKTPTAKKNKKK